MFFWNIYYGLTKGIYFFGKGISNSPPPVLVNLTTNSGLTNLTTNTSTQLTTGS